MLSALAMQHQVRIDRMIGAPGHGKGECDSLGGVDKARARKQMETVATPEASSDKHRHVDAHNVIDGRIQSFSDQVV